MNFIKDKIKAIIFDMDGTIIKTEDSWEQVIKDFLAYHGFTQLTKKQEDFLKDIGSTGLKNSVPKLKKEFGIQGCEEKIIAKKVEIFQNYMIKKGVNFVDGFEAFHNQLKQNQIATGLATNANLSTLQFLKEKANLKNFFGNNMYCLADVQNKAKPDPALFLLTIQKLNVKPEECIIFEDSNAGFQAAKSVGIKCIAIKNEFNTDILHHADGVIETYHEAQEAIKKLIK